MAGKSCEGYSLQRYHLWLCILASIFVKWVIKGDRTMSHLVFVPFPEHVPLAIVLKLSLKSTAETVWRSSVPWRSQTQRTIQVRKKIWNWILHPSRVIFQFSFNFEIRSEMFSWSHHSHFEALPRMGISQCLLSLVQEVGQSNHGNLFSSLLRDSSVVASSM